MNAFYKYNIIKYDYNINIIISKYLIQIFYKEQIIYIKKSRIWNNQKRFIITNNDKITILHPMISKNSKLLYKHMIDAFHHIDPFLTEHDILFLFISILSLNNYPMITKKFRVLWQNQLIIENCKLLTYKLNYEKITIIK